MKRVLVVDDDGPVRRIINHHLTKAGFEVVEAEDGMKALQVVRGTPVDVILLDIRMPIMNGYELAEELRADATTAGIPIVVSSVVADEAQGRIIQARTFQLRPFHVKELVAAVVAAVGPASP